MVVLHSFLLDGDSAFYRTGEDKLCNEGDFITFDVDHKNNCKDVRKAQGEPPASAPAPAPRSNGGFKPRGGGGARNEYWEDKAKRDIEVVEPRITWASATSDAVKLVTAALEHDLLSFGNANKGAKLGLLLEYVDQVTARFAVERFNAAENLRKAIALSGSAKADASEKQSDGDLG